MTLFVSFAEEDLDERMARNIEPNRSGQPLGGVRHLAGAARPARATIFHLGDDMYYAQHAVGGWCSFHSPTIEVHVANEDTSSLMI